MQVKKVFSVDSKQMCPKPLYVKPKYKTYRQLLDLDRPKKIIQHESDDQNDDFLQKLMKREERKKKEEKQKQKEKKQSAKSKNLSQAPSQKNKKDQLLPQKQDKLMSNKNSRLPSARSNKNQQNESVEYKQKKNDTEEIRLDQNLAQTNIIPHAQQDQDIQGIENSATKSTKKQSIKVVIKKKNSSQSHLLSNIKLESDTKSNTKVNTQQQLYNNLIKLSQTQANKVIKNTFITSHKLRKSDGLKQLQKNLHQQISNLKNPSDLIQTKLNPQKQIIQHKICPQKFIKENQISYSERAKDFLLKSSIAEPLQMVLMASKSLGNFQSKYKTQMIARKSLFKSSYQQELFVKSLKKQ